MMFSDRRAAGRALAGRLGAVRDQRPVILALLRGGLPVAFEVASALAAPLDVIVVRKLGVPSQPELAMGALGEEGVMVVEPDVVDRAGITAAELDAVARRERAVLEQRVTELRAHYVPVDISGRTAVIVDDGMATGATARAACAVARRRGAARVVLAVPVAARGAVADLAEAVDADEVVTVSVPRRFRSVGESYLDFAQTSDEEVTQLLDAARRPGFDLDGPPPDRTRSEP